MAGRGGSGLRTFGFIAGVLGLAVSAVGVGVISGVWNLQTGTSIATLVTIPLMTVPMAVQLVGWWRSGPEVLTTAGITEAKNVLAGKVADQWKTEAAVRSLDHPMPVQWCLTDKDQVMGYTGNLVTGALSFDESSDQVVVLAEKFRTLRRRRLVILGRPGSGKTTLAVQLLRRLLDCRQEDDPVPVLLSVASWDTKAYPRLQDWLAVRLGQDYPALRAPELGADVPRVLTARGQILPVLDGLDELPEDARAAVIGALNQWLGSDDQLILTSRTDEFAQAVEAAGNVLTSATVIEPEPLTPEDAAGYLHSYLSRRPGPIWEQILTSLRAPVRPPGPETALAEMVSTPLGLWLVRAVYLAPGADPAALLEPGRFPDAASLRAHLLDRLIPALIATRQPSTDPAEPPSPFLPRRLWDPDQVSRWLSYLAHHLNQLPTTDGQTKIRDFAWWQLARHTLRPRPLKWIIGLVTGLPVTLVSWLAIMLKIGFSGEDAIVAVGLLVFMGLFGFMFGSMISPLATSWLEQSPGFAVFHLGGRVRSLARQVMINWLLFGIGGGLVIGFAAGFAAGFRIVLTFGLGLGLGLGFARWAETPTPMGQASTPMSNWRADRALTLFRIITVGIGVGLTLGFWPGLMPGFEVGFASRFAMGFVFGLPMGFVFGYHHAWVVYVVATYRLARDHRLPRRLMPFLDDAHRLGLLRAVGPIYEFRHAQLQDHLAETYRQRG